MKHFLVVFAVLISPFVSAQGFISNRVQPMLSAQENYSQYLNLPPQLTSWNCPPDLARNTSKHFSFLDSIPLNPQFDEELLSQFMMSNCANYYTLLLQHLNSKPLYDSILLENEVAEKFSILPLLVSGCNPTLKYQSDKSGEWQLSYINARKYGLLINQWEDERNSTTLSSIAAANYLKFLNEYYLNNELLVITAYLTSVPYVNRKLNELDTINSVRFYETLDTEMQGYFSYLKSWTNWIEHFKQPLPETYTSILPEKKLVAIMDTLEFETISRFMKIPTSELINLNPVLVGQKVFPEIKTAFYLPTKKASEFKSKYVAFVTFQKEEEARKKKELARLKKQMESGIPDLTKYKAVTYTVKSGDVLGKIASRNNVKVSQIKQWNNLKSDRINIGQKLVLYIPKKSKVSLPEETADNKIETKPTSAKPGIGEPTIYEVKNGDSLWLISKKFAGVSAENIMEWNGCTDKISPGMKLKIYQPTN